MDFVALFLNEKYEEEELGWEQVTLPFQWGQEKSKERIAY